MRPSAESQNSGNQETVCRRAELEIEDRSRMEIRATERGMSQENLEIIVHGGIATVGFALRFALNREGTLNLRRGRQVSE